MSRPLVVAVDGRRLQERPLGGVGRWLANLLPHLAAEADIVLLTDRRRPPVSASVPESALWLPSRLPELVWVQMSAAWWLRGFSGVFHGTFNALPAAWRGPAVVTVHDLAALHHPEDFQGDKLRLATWKIQLRRAVHQACAIHTHSKHIRDAIIATYGVDPDRIVVAPIPVDPVFSPTKRDAGLHLAARLGVSSPYVIAIGGAPRRGLPVAIQAWQQARNAGADEELIVVGPDTPEPRPGLHYVGRLLDEEWASLLAGATAFCYPTRYEGFGLPALEAAGSGVPVICPRTGPLPDILGEAAEWCETSAASRIGEGLMTVLFDQARQAQLRRAGLARVADSITWAESARFILDAYRLAAA